MQIDIYSKNKGLFYKIKKIGVARISKRLSSINQKTVYENYKVSKKIVLISSVISIIYFVFCISLFNTLWYHKMVSIVSAVLIFFICMEVSVEIIDNKFKKKLPRLIRIFSYYYQHYEGNLNKALDSSIERLDDDSKIYLQKIKTAINKEDYNYEIDKLKTNIDSVWLKLLCNIVVFAKRDGKSDVIAPNIEKLNKIINFVNLSQGKNNVEFLWIEIGLFILPIIFIPFVHIYNGYILEAMDFSYIYGDSEAQTKAAILLVASNISAMIIDWIRKIK